MNLQRSIRVVGALLLLFSFNVASNAQRDRDRDRDRGGRWQYLGQSRVDGRADHDTIRVNARGPFRSILLEVQGGAIEFNRVVVRFENGADHQVDVRERIRAGGRTRAIDLPGDRRNIRSVELWYERGNWRSRRPTLRLHGRR
ncbi:MAG: hypothetical protein AABN33_05735 [Acidobacteriota bacterium]